MDFPEVEELFLKDFLTSLKKRRKAIKYNFKNLNCQKVYEVHDNYQVERLELYLGNDGYSHDRQFQFDIWPDRWMRASGKLSSRNKNYWRWEYDGRLLPVVSSRELVQAIEDSTQFAPWENLENLPNYLNQVSGIWSPILAKGPVGVK